MASCFDWIKGRNKTRNIKLVIIGLDDAGKTTTVASLEGEPPDGIAPTLGFANATLKMGRWNITLYDLGGGSSVRGVWNKYFAEVYGIIFAVDSGNADRLSESRDALSDIFHDTRAEGKPILVYANKQDKEDALDKQKISEELQLEQMSEKYSFKFAVYPCSAIKGYGKKIDKSIKDGLSWLLKAIAADYTSIDDRVTKDSAAQKEIEAKERKERLARIQKLREEREKAAKEAGVAEEEEESDDDVVTGNPFKNINDQIGITEKREKKEKEKRKKIEAFQKQKEEEIETPQAEDETSKTPTKKPKKKKGKKAKTQVIVDDSDHSQQDEGGKLGIPSIRLQPATPNGSSVSLKSPAKTDQKSSDVSENEQCVGNNKKKKKKRPLPEVDTPEDEDEVVDSFNEMTLCNGTSKKKKKKKKKVVQYTEDEYESMEEVKVDKSNRRTRFQVDDEDDYIEHPVPKKGKKKKKNRDLELETSSNSNFSTFVHEVDDFSELDETPRVARTKKKKSPRRARGYEEEDDNQPIPKKKSPRSKTREQDINDSRAELFRAKGSLDSLSRVGSEECLEREPTTKKKKSKKYMPEVRSDMDETQLPERPVKKKKKRKKMNRTAPAPHPPPDDMLSDEDWKSRSWNGNLPQISAVPKLEPLRHRGKLPQIQGADYEASQPPWARARPNSEDHDIMM